MLSSHISVCTLPEFSALLKWLTTPPFLKPSLCWLLWYYTPGFAPSYLTGFLSFSSSAWPLNVGVPPRLCPGAFFSSLSIYFLQWTGASCLFSLELWTLSLNYVFVPGTFNSLTSASSSPQKPGSVQLPPYLRSLHWCPVGIANSTWPGQADPPTPTITPHFDFSIPMKWRHDQPGIQGKLKWQAFFT